MVARQNSGGVNPGVSPAGRIRRSESESNFNWGRKARRSPQKPKVKANRSRQRLSNGILVAHLGETSNPVSGPNELLHGGNEDGVIKQQEVPGKGTFNSEVLSINEGGTAEKAGISSVDAAQKGNSSCGTAGNVSGSPEANPENMSESLEQTHRDPPQTSDRPLCSNQINEEQQVLSKPVMGDIWQDENAEARAALVAALAAGRHGPLFPLPPEWDEIPAEGPVQSFMLPKKLRASWKNWKPSLVAPGDIQPPPFKLIHRNVYTHRSHRVLDGDEVAVCECKYVEGDPQSACGPDRCINALLNTECTPGFCPCGDRCLNQRFQRCQYPRAKVVRTEGRGWGLFADQDIEAGQFVQEYCGEVIPDEEAHRRAAAYVAGGEANAYILMLSGSEFVDATKKGAWARFLNHSCAPNCEARKWMVLGEIRAGVFARQDIPAGTELMWDYNFEWYGGEKVRCRCGAPACVGFLGAKSRAFQDDLYLWEDDDDRFEVEDVPTYDSEEEPGEGGGAHWEGETFAAAASVSVTAAKPGSTGTAALTATAAAVAVRRGKGERGASGGGRGGGGVALALAPELEEEQGSARPMDPIRDSAMAADAALQTESVGKSVDPSASMAFGDSATGAEEQREDAEKLGGATPPAELPQRGEGDSSRRRGGIQGGGGAGGGGGRPPKPISKVEKLPRAGPPGLRPGRRRFDLQQALRRVLGPGAQATLATAQAEAAAAQSARARLEEELRGRLKDAPGDGKPALPFTDAKRYMEAKCQAQFASFNFSSQVLEQMVRCRLINRTNGMMSSPEPAHG